jgi:hypothetical protein
MSLHVCALVLNDRYGHGEARQQPAGSSSTHIPGIIHALLKLETCFPVSHLFIALSIGQQLGLVTD